jgi:hypothetical protein
VIELRNRRRNGLSQENHLAKSSLALSAVLAIVSLFAPAILHSDDMLVRHRQGALRGFLVLRTPDGAMIADGEVSQVVSGVRVAVKTQFHFKDGSIYEEKATFSQSKSFRLLNYHLIERGPSFPKPMEVSMDCLRGQVEVHALDDKGQNKVIRQHVDLPSDLANGLLCILLENLQPGTPKTTFSFLTTTPKPRIVRLNITPTGTKDPFWVGNSKYEAVHYTMKVDIGGIAGKVAPLIGKQPPDTQISILDGTPPLLVKFEGQLFEDGPIWQLELTAPTWKAPASGDHP